MGQGQIIIEEAVKEYLKAHVSISASRFPELSITGSEKRDIVKVDLLIDGVPFTSAKVNIK